ncbi:MAG: M28 family peptidase, partial [Caldilineaceae bacterium]|nr:M28 family peptidase [Caldilineaceae bacterium]
QISTDRLWETNGQIAQWVRHSGTEEERAAFDYVQQTLDAYGLQTTLLEHPALVSYPLKASLSIIDGDDSVLVPYEALGTAYSVSTEGLEAEVVDLGYGTPDDYAKQDVSGKIVLLNGLATPTAVYAAEQAGAIGQIFINDDHHHYMIVSTIWGTPTPDSAERIPSTSSLSLTETDGHDLRNRIAAGSVRVRLQSDVFMDWQQTPILIAELPGTQSDEFVMFSGHLDSWEVGAMDNGSANATMMEVGRLLAQYKDELYRGLRLYFWSGHSHGRYSGSTWYVDNHWEELYDRCVAHVNVDSTGARGATHYGSFPANRELGGFGAQIIQEQTGQDSHANRMSRAGDMSFNGVGIPAMFMTLSAVPVDPANTNYVTEAAGKLLGAALPWWWHTSEDTMDKVDLDVLLLDTKIYVSTLWRLCHEALLPMDFGPVVADIQQTLQELQSAAGDHLDLSQLQQRADALATAIEKLANSAPTTADAVVEHNAQIKSLSRALIPITYTAAGHFDHDPAWPMPHIPPLRDVPKLAQLDPNSDEYHFFKTQLVRNRNAVSFALRQALEVLA